MRTITSFSVVLFVIGSFVLSEEKQNKHARARARPLSFRRIFAIVDVIVSMVQSGKTKISRSATKLNVR